MSGHKPPSKNTTYPPVFTMIHCPQIHWTIYSSHSAVKHFSRPCSYSLGTKQKKTDRNVDLANKKGKKSVFPLQSVLLWCALMNTTLMLPILTLGSLLQGLIVLHQYSPGFGGHEAFRRVLSFASHLTHPCPWDEVIVLMAEKKWRKGTVSFQQPDPEMLFGKWGTIF